MPREKNEQSFFDKLFGIEKRDVIAVGNKQAKDLPQTAEEVMYEFDSAIKQSDIFTMSAKPKVSTAPEGPLSDLITFPEATAHIPDSDPLDEDLFDTQLRISDAQDSSQLVISGLTAAPEYSKLMLFTGDDSPPRAKPKAVSEDPTDDTDLLADLQQQDKMASDIDDLVLRAESFQNQARRPLPAAAARSNDHDSLFDPLPSASTVPASTQATFDPDELNCLDDIAAYIARQA